MKLQEEDISNNGDKAAGMPDQTRDKRRPILTWPDAAPKNKKQNVDEL
jgi:hypothetical protein